MSASLTLAAPIVLAGESDKSGPLGLAVILVLCVICYLLFKSMSKHLRKVREEFPDGSAANTAPEATAAAPTAAGGPTAAPALGPAEANGPEPATVDGSETGVPEDGAPG